MKVIFFLSLKKKRYACNLWLHYVGVAALLGEKNYNSVLLNQTDQNNDETRASSPHAFTVKWNLDPFSHEKHKRKAVSHKERLHTRKTYGNCQQHYQARLCRVDLPWVASVTKCQSKGLSLHLWSPVQWCLQKYFEEKWMKYIIHSFKFLHSLFYISESSTTTRANKDHLSIQYQTTNIISLTSCSWISHYH